MLFCSLRDHQFHWRGWGVTEVGRKIFARVGHFEQQGLAVTVYSVG